MLERTAGSPGLDEREFTIVKRGYDPREVKAYLRDLETGFSQLEEWATQTKARLVVAEERVAHLDELDGAMLAIFEAKEDVLERAQQRADRIVANAEEEARQITNTATASVTPAPVDDPAWEDDPELVVTLPHSEADEADGQTRYERQSAQLPSIGEQASSVIGSMQRFREDGIPG